MSTLGRCRGDDHLVSGAAGVDAAACRRADLAQLRAAGQHHPAGVDRACGGVDPDDAAAAGAQPGEGTALADVDAVRDQRGGVGQHVAWRVDVAVTGCVRRAHGHAGCQTRVSRVEFVAAEPFHGEAEALLQGDAFVRLLHFGFGERRHEVALRDEPAVERIAITTGDVELLGAQTELDGGLGAALCADHARRTAACAVAEGGGFEQDDLAYAAFGEQDGGPGTDRPSADHHHVGMSGTSHSTKR